MSASANTALAFDVLLILAGLGVIWKLAACPAARANPAPPRLGPSPLSFTDLLMFLWYLVPCGLLVQGSFWSLARAAKAGADNETIFGGIGFQLGLLIGCAAFRFLRPRTSRPPVPSQPPEAKPANLCRPATAGAIAFLAALPLIALSGAVWRLILWLLGNPLQEQDLVGLFMGAHSPAIVAVLLFMTIAIAPIAEELIFRGVLFRYARQNFPRGIALVGPALLFGALHLNIASFVPLVVLGMVLSLAYERTGDIRVPMIAHGLFNLNSLLLVYAGVNG